MKNTVIVLLLISGVFILNSCQNHKKEESKAVVNQMSKEDKMTSRFVGKKVTSFNQIISEKDMNNIKGEKIVLLYTGYDCQSCVDKGFEVIKKIDSLYPHLHDNVTNKSVS